MKQRLIIGIIRTSHGVSGWLKLKSLSGETEHFRKLKDIYLSKKGTLIRFRVEEIRITADSILIKLDGIETPEQGKEFCGSEVWADREYACPLEKDEYYYGDMCGCIVKKDETIIGKVLSVFESGNSHILEILDADNKTLLIPFTDEYIGDVDIKKGTIIAKREKELM